VTHTGIEKLAPSGSVWVRATLSAATSAVHTLNAPPVLDAQTTSSRETLARDDAAVLDDRRPRTVASGAASAGPLLAPKLGATAARGASAVAAAAPVRCAVCGRRGRFSRTGTLGRIRLRL
jgi:hypothetical protein